MKQSAAGRERKLAILATCILAAFTFVFAEIAVRLILPYNTPDTIRQHSLEYVPAVYARHLIKPLNKVIDTNSDKGWNWKEEDDLSEQLYFINANGYRGPSFDVHNKENKTRIIALGGSAVFDQYVWDTLENHSRTWPHQVERNLHAKGFSNVEVINAGIPGHSSADSLGRLVSQIWTYSPDIILVYHGWNDMKLWHKSQISPEHPLINQVPVLDVNSNPFISYRGVFDRLLSNSQVYVKFRNRFFKWKIDTGPEGVTSGAQKNTRADTYSEFGPRQFRLNLEQIISASHSIGAKPILISQATLIAKDNTDADIERISFPYQDLSHSALIRAYFETYSIIQELGSKTNTFTIDAAGPMNGKSEFFADHVHTTPAGSTQLAKIVADNLAKVLSESESESQ